MFIKNMQENRHTLNIIAQVLPNVNNLQELKKQFLQEIYAILQIIYKKFKSIFDTPQQAPVHTKV